MVAVMGEPRATLLPTGLGIMLAGATCTPIPLDCGTAVLTHKLTLTKPKYAFCTRLFWETHSDVLKKIDFIKSFICFDGVIPDIVAGDVYVKCGRGYRHV